MPLPIIRDAGKILVQEFPIIERSKLQEDIRYFIETSNSTNLMYTRRAGKTTEAALSFFTNACPDLDLVFNYEKGKLKPKFKSMPLIRNGITFLCCHPMGMDLYSRFYDGPNAAFLHPFGGKKGLQGGSLDNVYVRLPKRYFEYLFTPKGQINPERTKDELEYWFGDPAKKIEPIIYAPLVPQLAGQIYVKLFKENVGKSTSSKHGDSISRGLLFNGVNIELIPANHYFDRYVRGKAIHYIWGEEIGEWDTDYISESAIQAVIQVGGKVVTTMTPPNPKSFPNPKDHWTYKNFVEPLGRPDPYRKYTKYHGVDVYISERRTSVPVKIEGREQYVMEEVVKKNTLLIGRLPDCYQSTHDTTKIFAEVVQSLKEVVNIITITDENGEIKLDKDGHPILTLQYTGQPNAGGNLEMNTWWREYCMSYDAISTYTTFNAFGEHNILPAEHVDYFRDNFPSICGFDKGMAEVNEFTQEVLTEGSTTFIIDMAKVGENQWVVYNERLLNYDIESSVAPAFLARAQKGIPIVFDYVLSTATDMKGSKRNNDLEEIIQSEKRLRRDYRNGLYHRCLVGGVKKNELERVNRINALFRLTTGDISPIPHPIDKREPGAKLYITDNCVRTIKYFREQTYKQDKEGHLEKDKNNNLILKKMMDEPFDCISYPLDTYLFGTDKATGKPYRKVIEDIWNNPKYKSTIYQQGEVIQNPVTVFNTFGRGFRMVAPGRRNW